MSKSLAAAALCLAAAPRALAWAVQLARRAWAVALPSAARPADLEIIRGEGGAGRGGPP